MSQAMRSPQLLSAPYRSRQERDRPFARHNPKVPQVERQHLATMSFRAGNDGCIGESEGKIVVAAHQLLNPGQIFLATIKEEAIGEQIIDEGIEESCLMHPLQEI